MERRGITRRDLLHGVTLPLAGAALAGALPAHAAESPSTGANYPPARTGLRGDHPGSFEVVHALAREGARWPRPSRQTDDTYDLVVVGAGLSGLAAAYLFRAQAGARARILLIDNHDDFGGHAKRNEFRVDGRTLIGYGGSQSIDSPRTYSRVARSLIREIGIDTERFEGYFDHDFGARHGLGQGVLFEAARYGQNRLVGDVRAAADAAARARWLEAYPLSAAGRQGLARLFDGDMNRSAAVREALAAPQRAPLERFLRDAFDMTDDALALLRDSSLTLWGFGLDGLSLREGADGGWLGPALARAVAADGAAAAGSHGNEPYIYHFPDGNAGIARLLVRSLIPGAMAGASMEDAVTARVRYGRLDRAENRVRIRLESTAVEVRNLEGGGGAEVVYVRGGSAERVAGRHVVLACNNRVVPYLCPEIGGAQREALLYAERVPLVVMNIALRQWRPIADAGFREVYTPGGFLVRSGLDFPVSMGGYAFSGGPDEPVLLDCWHAGIDPDTTLHVFERLRRGRHAMLARPFEAYEAAARAQLDAAWGPHGLDVDRDVAAMTVNRWPHGYAWEYTDLWDEPGWSRGAGPHVVGRQQVGRISIANSDAEAFAYVNGAIDAAYRAVREQTTP